MARLRIIACIFALFLGGRAVAEPRVAVIGSPSAGVEKLLPLVELRLAKQPGLALLEREKISEVFREQELSALTAAEGTAKRVALGKLLKADVLVVLRGEEKPIPHAWVVICETRQGLRLCNQPVECGTKVEDRAEAVLKLVERALAKHEGQIKEIVAVPPLVSNDLGFESQALQKPLANVIEQSLLTRPHVLAVELAEAKAVADELAVSGDESIQRRLPLYLLGDFRHQENGDNAKLAVHLKLMRGQKLMGDRELKDVAPADLANALRREAASLLDKAMDTTAPLPDPTTEAQQLAQRAIVLYQLMNFYECLELCEASLLLKPDQTDIHRLAAHSAAMHVSMLLRKAADKPVPYGAERLKQAIMQENEATLRRGLPHLEYFMEHAAVSATRDRVLILGYFQCCQEIKDIRPMVLRILAAKQKAGMNDDTIMFVRRFRQWGFQGMTADEILRWKLEAAQAWPRADAQGVLNLVDVVAYGTDGSDSPELRDTCKRLREIINPAGPGAADFIETRWRAGHVANPDVLRRPVPTKPDAPYVDGMGVKFVPLPLAPLPGLFGWTAAGVSDVAWTGRELYLVKDKDRDVLQPVGEILATDDCSPVAFDGKYVWAFQNAGDGLKLAGLHDVASQPRLVAIDPATSKHWFLSTDSGLPPMTLRAVSFAPLGAGKVCVVGHFGEQRMTRVWFAMASLDSDTGRGTVKVFHDARDVPPVRHGDEWKNPHMAFSRGYVFTLTAPQTKDGKPLQRIVADRRYTYPLVIDPELRTVEVSSGMLDCVPPGIPVPHGDALYSLNMEPGSDKLYVYRFGLPDFKTTRGEHQVPLGRLAFCRQWSVLLDTDGDAWIAAHPQGPFRRFRGAFLPPPTPMPPDLRFFASGTGDLLLYDTKTGRMLKVVLPPDKELTAVLADKASVPQ